MDEDAYDHLRARAEILLGTALPPVQRRWAGVYSQVTEDELYHRSLIDALDWRPLIALALSPADAGRGRPWPDCPAAGSRAPSRSGRTAQP